MPGGIELVGCAEIAIGLTTGGGDLPRQGAVNDPQLFVNSLAKVGGNAKISRPRGAPGCARSGSRRPSSNFIRFFLPISRSAWVG